MFQLDKLLKVVDPEPVLINQQACLRARHIRSACRACSAICPTEAFGFENRKLTVDSTKCTKCGLCLGACPTSALQVRGIDEALLDGATAVRCARAAGDGVEIPCLGALSVDHLVDLGSRCPGVTLTCGDCESCDLAKGGAAARVNLAAAVDLLRALGVDQRPVWQSAQKGADVQAAISRRDLFSLWRQSAVQTGRSLLPDRDVNHLKLPAKVPKRRLRWVKRFESGHQPERLTWPTRTVTDGCIGCTICVAFCPTGALGAREEGEDWVLTFQPVACVDCGTCMQLCPRRVVARGENPLVDDLLGGTRSDLVRVPASMRPQTGGFKPPQ